MAVNDNSYFSNYYTNQNPWDNPQVINPYVNNKPVTIDPNQAAAFDNTGYNNVFDADVPEANVNAPATGGGGGPKITANQIQGAMGAVGLAYDMFGNISSLAGSDPSASIPSQYYANPYTKPQDFVDPENPYEKGVGASRALEYGLKGAAAGSAFAPGIGTAIGAGVGIIGGLAEGAINAKKRKEFEEGVRKERLAYDESYGNYQSNVDMQRRNLRQDLYNQRRMQSTFIPPNTIVG